VAPPGRRIRVTGEFDGFTYETGSMTFSIPSTGLCSGDGGGTVWVELANMDERSKVVALQPRRTRQRLPGDTVTVEGTVAAPQARQSIKLLDALVR
jgi:hypothetical protein